MKSDTKPQEFGADALSRMGRVLIKRRLVVVLTMALVVVATVAYTRKQPKIYKASASLIIENRTPAVLSRVQEVIEMGAGSYWSNTEYLNTQILVLKSRNMAKRVSDRLGLSVDERYLGLADAKPPLSRAELRRRMASMDAVTMLLNSLDVTPQRESRLVILSVEHTDPGLATEIANAYADEYKRHNLELKKRTIQDANEELEDMLKRLKDEKDHAEARVLAFEQENGVGSLKGRKEAVQLRLQQLTEVYQKAKVERIALESSRLRAELQENISDVQTMLRNRDPEKVVHPRVISNSEVMGLRAQLTELKVRTQDLAARYGEKHPKLIAVAAQSSLVRAGLRNAVSRILGAELEELNKTLKEEDNRLFSQEDREKGLLEELRAAREEESALIQIELEYEPLVNKKNEILGVYNSVKERYSETTLSAQVETNNVRIQDLAVRPSLPVKPNFTLNLLAGILLSIVISIGAAFFIESLDNTIRDRADIEGIEGVRFLGILPSIGRVIHAVGVEEYSRERDMYPFTHSKSTAAELLRSIQTNVMYGAFGKRPKVLLVVSPSPREGKTTVACQLGITFAMSGLKILLVDTDMRRPRLHKALGTKPKNGGIAVYMVQGGNIEDYISRTQVPGLDLFGCGLRPPNPIELLQSATFGRMVEELKARYDLVLFDSPPLLAVADSRILVTYCDDVVCVAKAGRTTRDSLREGREQLRNTFPGSIGCVVNDVDISSGSYHYYYYYGRKYGYYATPDEIPDEAEGSKPGGGLSLVSRVRTLWRNRSV